MRNLFLLLVIGLHLIHLVLLLGFDICGVIAVIVNQFLLHRKIHDIRANRVHKILRMRCDDEDMVVC